MEEFLMSLLQVNKINLNVEIQGNGDPLILIHGISMDNTQWKYEIARLNQYCKTISLDCRGHGKSDKPDSYTLEDHVQDIISLMDILDYKVANIYGVSMGSYIAQGVAVAQPDRIKKLILTVPTSNGLTSSTQRLISNHAEELTDLTDDEIIQHIAKYVAYNPKIRADLANILKTSLTPAQISAANKALTGFDYRNELHKITAETLIISGKHDELNPPSEGKVCADLIPKASFVEMKYSGHLPMLEEQQTYNEIIDKFLQPHI